MSSAPFEPPIGLSWPAEQRRVLHEVQPLYTALQALEPTLENILEYSRTVGAVLGRQPDPETAEAAVICSSDALALQRALWECLEAAFVLAPNAAVSTAAVLCLWHRRNARVCNPGPDGAPCALERLLPALSTLARAEDAPGFWAVVTQCAALGWGGIAAQILSFHSVWVDGRLRKPAARATILALSAVDRLLRAMPPGGATGDDVSAWRALLRSTLDDTALWQGPPDRDGDALQAVLRAANGDDATLVAATSCWVELLGERCSVTVWFVLTPSVSHSCARALHTRVAAAAAPPILAGGQLRVSQNRGACAHRSW